jgi:hypothetical protein
MRQRSRRQSGDEGREDRALDSKLVQDGTHIVCEPGAGTGDVPQSLRSCALVRPRKKRSYKMRRAFLPLLIPAILCYGCASTPATPPSGDYHHEISAGLEEIYILRTVRKEHTQGATPACAAAPFEVANEDVYELWSMEQQSSDGRLLQTHKEQAGSFRICIGPLAAGKPFSIYTVFQIGGKQHTGLGQCSATPGQPPLKTLLGLSCVANASDLPPEYAGGSMISSTLAPVLGRDQPVDAHVPGYLSTSIIVMRLWKKPKT